MRVLFIERNLRNEKLGIMYLSASLKRSGHHADLIQSDKNDIDHKIIDYKPDFIAFSITTGEHIYALNCADYIKKKYNIKNIFGGPHCTFFPEIAVDDRVDFVIQGQGEQAILDVVEGRIPRGLHKREMVNDLDDMPFPDREIFYQFDEFKNNPVKNVITSRACPYRCSYCFNHSQLALTHIDGETKQWFNRRSVENVIQEIDILKSEYGVNKILFIDDSFIQSKNWLNEFLDSYTSRVRLPWMCSLRVNCLDENLAEKMFNSGLEMVNYAMESADPDVQQRLLHRGHISNGDVIRAIRLFDKYGVRARMQNMIGLPLNNSLEDALNTLQFNMRHRVTDSWCSIFQPYPRTALGQYCLDHGYCSSDQLKHCSESFFDESRLNISHRDELYALQKLWYFIIDGHLDMDLVQILIKGKITSKLGDSLQRLRFRYSRKKLYGIEEEIHNTRIRSSREISNQYDIQSNDTGDNESESSSLIKKALKSTALDDDFIQLASEITFTSEQLGEIRKYIDGERVYDKPLYTINDETGELIDPENSIYTRGVDNPESQDIRKMPEMHFMAGMDTLRNNLLQGIIPVSISVVVKHDDEYQARETDDVDERHLNQYLS